VVGNGIVTAVVGWEVGTVVVVSKVGATVVWRGGGIIDDIGAGDSISEVVGSAVGNGKEVESDCGDILVY